MIRLKSEEEIEIMKEGGSRLRKIVKELLSICQIGITTKEIDEYAEKLIEKFGGKPSFKEVKGYFWATCLPINEQVVHTPPSKRILKEGDLLTLDIGMKYRGYHTDYAETIIVGAINNKKIYEFLQIGRRTLNKAINQMKVGKRIGDISEAIEEEIYDSGFYVIKQLTGHGIGRKLHEEPYVFGFLDKPKKETLLIQPGLTVAIEVIYSMGTEEIMLEKGSNWSLVTKDKSLAACFEHTVAMTNLGPIVLT